MRPLIRRGNNKQVKHVEAQRGEDKQWSTKGEKERQGGEEVAVLGH